ncbi:MAG: hypothetical protein ACYDAC_10035 [Candidatus Dormibacteria bacterium]
MSPLSDPFAGARTASAAAAESARDAVSRLQSIGSPARMAQFGFADVVSGSFPDHPLLTMAHDLVLAGRAAAHAAEATARLGHPGCAGAAAEAALLTADLLTFTTTVASRPELRSDPINRERIAHAASLVAFSAAELLDRWPRSGAPHAESASFPHPWSRVIALLQAEIAQCGAPASDELGQRLLRSARAAADGAAAARRSYERSSAAGGSRLLARRFVGLAALTAAYAGCAALVPLRKDSASAG